MIIKMENKIAILGIETSCDETSAAVLIDGEVVSNVVSSQEMHHKFGGVVPELASRAHQKYIVPIVNKALQIAKVNRSHLKAVAYTNGPGLMGSLLVGVNFAKFFAYGLKIPSIAVNHIEAHIYSVLMETDELHFPFLTLIVSGGHTQLILVEKDFKYQIIGETKDDAVGEAFDKVAKLLNMPYPGGPEIDKRSVLGKNDSIKFPIAFNQEDNFNFSFSGIKTSVLYYLRDNFTNRNIELTDDAINNICASFQSTVVNTLIKKTFDAAKKYEIKNIAIAGGVSANKELRQKFKSVGEEKNIKIFIPKIEYCTDNAAMIGFVGYRKYLIGKMSEINSTAVPDLMLV